MIKLLLLIISISVFAIIPGTLRDDLSNDVLKLQFTRFGFSQGGHCTGTAIGEYKILTAGHCVKSYTSYRPKSLKLNINGKAYSLRSISVPDGFIDLQARYDSSIANKDEFSLILKDLSKIDVAIVTLKKPLHKSIKITSLASHKSSIQDALLCGYGHSLFESGKYSENVPAKLLCGTNRYLYKDGLLFLKGNILNASHANSLTGPGDSGSPLFNSEMKQIGVLSGITKNDLGDATSYYANLFNLKEFIFTNL